MKKLYLPIKNWLTLSILTLFCALGVNGQTAIPISAVNVEYNQDFNNLSAAANNTLVNFSSSPVASTDIPLGWTILETGSNANSTYRVSDGSSNSGDSFSFGTSGQSDRAIGTLLSGSLKAWIGASFTNNTGTTINTLKIKYTGEQWRRGASDAQRSTADELRFSYLTSGFTAYNAGTWTRVEALDFKSPIISGAARSLDGNNSDNREEFEVTIIGLNIQPNDQFWIRWEDIDVTSSDDGLGIDDFSVVANPVAPSIVANPTSINYGNVAPATNANSTIDVTGSNLTGSIGATIVGGSTSVFTISTNETVYNESVTLPSAGAPLYVRFSPPASGVYNETLRLSSTGAQSIDITLTGVGFDENALVSLSAVGTTYTQDFNVLSSAGLSSNRPEGWFFFEQGSSANNTYAAGNGSSNGGNTYSFGATNDSDRALGSLASASLRPIYLGAGFENTSTDQVYNGFDVNYFAELWRRGTNSNGDFLTFYYSTDATSLQDDDATWVEYNPLTARTSDIGLGGTTNQARNGNSSDSRNQYTNTLNGLAVFPAQKIWFRWVDTDISGSDDGLGIDDFEITPTGFNVNDPYIIALTQDIDFGQVFITTDSDVTEFDLVVDNLSSAITINSTLGAFQVSADGVTFGSTANLPSTGGKVFVKFNSANEGNFNGGLEFISSANILATVDLSGTAIDPFNNIITIAEARAKSLNEFVAVEGIVTVGKEFGGGPSYIQDATGGIPFFNANFTSQIKIGDRVRVYGPISFFNDLKQISGDNFLGIDITTNPEFITPQLIPLADLADYEGQLVTVNAEFQNKNFVFTPNSNENIIAGGITREVRITGTTNIPGLAKPQSSTSITGVVGQFRGTPQLLPRFEQDISGAALPAASGSGLSRNQTLDVVTYNLEFFGASTPPFTGSFGPSNVTLQAANVQILLDSIDADIYALQEVSDVNLLQQVVNNLNGYALIMSNRYSRSWEGFTPDFAPQQLGFIYKTSTISPVSDRVMFEEMYDQARTGQSTPIINYPTGSASSFYSSGRLPHLLVADVNIQGIERRVNFINVHAKSGGSNIMDYNRRLYDATVLKDSIDQYFVDQDIIFLGDYNDELEGSILTSQSVSPYAIFFDDFLQTTRSLGANGARSTIGFSNVIDHIMATKTFEVDLISGSETVITPFRQIANYGNTTSDHLPVQVRFQLRPRLTETELTFIDEFYTEMNGEGWFNNSGWVDGNGNQTGGALVASRFGLTVEKVNPVTVTAVVLPRNNLTGQFPSSLLNFGFLETLDLSGNNIVGAIPREILNLKNLKNLNISYNGLYTNDPEVKAFLDGLQPGWDQTQTVSPIGSTAELLNPSAIIKWTPIAYQGGTGRYFINYRAEDEGGFTTITVEGKNSSEGLIPNLEYGKKYLVYVQSQTDANPPFNPSAVTSDLGEVIELFFATPIAATERAALIALYEAMGGDDWTSNDNWKDPVNFSAAGTEFLWKGVTLSKVNNVWSVTSIDLSNNNLNGTLPDLFAAFPNLTSLNLSGNCLAGAVPASLSSLANLQTLNLSNNRFSSFTLTSLSATDVNLSYNAIGEGDDNTALLAQLQADYLATQTLTPSSISATTVGDASATLTWEAIAFTAGEGHYELRLRKVGTTNWSTRATENKGQTTLQYTGLEANTSYEVQIRSVRIQRAESCFTFSAWSESTTFMTLPAMPARAALSSPTDYALNTATSLNLVVKETAFAANYEIQLSTSQDFSAATTVSFTSASGEQAVDGLLNNTRYYWRARGVNARGAGEWSAMSQFRTGLSVASATVAGQVTCASEGAQVFMWNAIPGASHYRVEIASDANFQTVVKRASVQGLQLIVIDLRVNQTYYWRVQGYNDVSAYVGNWSSAGQLGVQPRIQVAGELELCSNARTTLSLETKAGTSIQWYANGTAIAGATSNSYTATAAGSYYAILTSTGNVCASYQTESVTITEAVVSVPAITASSTALCEGESTTLSTSATGNSYQWFRNGTAIAGATAQSYRTSEAGTYSVEVRANQTCSVTSNGLAINVTAVPQQQAIRVTGSLTLCGAADATSLSLTLAQGQTIQWYRNGTLLANATGASLSATQAGTYDAIIRNGTCSIRTASVEISGTILAKPVISMSQFGQTQINLGRPVAIQSTYAPTGVGYQWLYNGVPVEGANTAILLASRNGRYQMQLMSADGCTVISEEFVITYPAGKEPKDIPIRSLNPRDLMDIAKEISDGWLQAFPNPTQGMLTISVSADRLAGQESVDVRVVDFLGRGVYNGKLMLTGDRYEVNFNMANLSKGIYYIYVEDGNISHRKVVKKE